MMKSENNLRHRVRLFIFGLLLLLNMLLIFYMSGKSGAASREMSDQLTQSLLGRILTRILPPLMENKTGTIRKYAHIFEFFCLGLSSFLFFYELFLARMHRLSRSVLAASCWSFLYACSDEWHQTFVPERAGQAKDLLFDSAGFLFGIAILGFSVFMRRRRKGGVPQ